MQHGTSDNGPLTGFTLVEFAGIGPAPYAAMLLTDMGMEGISIDRTSPIELLAGRDPKLDLLRRNRRSIALDLKHPQSVAVALRIVATSDVLIEGFRPGVMERLG